MPVTARNTTTFMDPEKVTYPEVSFRSSDPSLAVVDENGTVKALPAGVGKTVYITAITTNGMKAVIPLKITEGDQQEPGSDQPGKGGDEGDQKDSQKQDPKPKAKGTKIDSDACKARFVVISKEGEKPAVMYTMPMDRSVKTISIPESIEYEGVTYAVTEIRKKAFLGCKNATKIVIPKSVEKLGTKLFGGCVKLKSIVFKTTKLKSSSVASLAFRVVPKNVKIKVPKKKKKAYKSFFPKKGLRKGIRIV